jgi:hypothetical protein
MAMFSPESNKLSNKRRLLLKALTASSLGVPMLACEGNELLETQYALDGIHLGAVMVQSTLRSGERLNFFREPLFTTEVLFPSDTASNRTNPSDRVEYSPYYLEFTIINPEIYLGDHPDTEDKKSGRWLKLPKGIRRVHYDILTRINTPYIDRVDGYVYWGQSTSEFIKSVEEDTEILRRGNDGNYRDPITRIIIPKSAIGRIQPGKFKY